MDESKNHVDTKLAIIVNSDRIVLHAYNSKQKLMVQGKGYEHFAINCLEPLFKQKIGESLDRIDNFNNDVKVTLGAPKALEKRFKCPQCELRTVKNGDLKVHMKMCHTKPGIESPPRNKVARILNEDVSLLDESVMNGVDIMDEISETDIVCEWLTCDFHSSDKETLRKHFEDEHMVYLREKYLSPKPQNMPEIENGIWCYICGVEADDQEQMDSHMKNKHPRSYNPTAEPSDSEVNTKISIIEDNTAAIDGKFEEPVSKVVGGSSDELERHNKINHAADNSVVSCEVCNITFSDLGNLNQHKQAYHMSVRVNIETEDTLPIVCDLCPYTCK